MACLALASLMPALATPSSADSALLGARSAGTAMGAATGESIGSRLPAGRPVSVATRTATTSHTQFGTTLDLTTGLSYTTAYQSANTRYGGLDAVRVFFGALPGKWSTSPLSVPAKPVIVSFKARPQDVLAGKLDTYLRNWFATAPRTKVTYWSYYHEPEDNVMVGDFTAAQYRAAFARIRGLANKTANPNLKSTLILMCWSLTPVAHRKWTDYYPGRANIDVLAWDCYSRLATSYESPASLLTQARDVSVRAGKPWAVAEYGAVRISGDTGSKRAAWLTTSSQWMSANHAVFGLYFDTNNRYDYRLRDSASISAWRTAVSAH